MVRPKKKAGSVGKKPAARKKSKSKMSGIGNINLQDVAVTALALTGGAVLARVGSNIVLKQWPNTKHVLIGAGQVAAGVILPNVVKAKWAKDVGAGMIAFGGQVLAVNTGVVSGISGIGSPGATMRYRIGGGPNNIRAINGGPNNIRAINGVPAKYAPKSKNNIAGLV
ncbi:MAG: hypothetical protein ABW007_02110 [Chitinophagaceae bacterium]